MRRSFASLVLAALAFVAAPAQAQTMQCSGIGPRVVWTVGQWSSCFASLQPALGYTPLNRAGDTMGGELTFGVSTTINAPFTLPPGSAPSAPKNGDVWFTSLGMYYEAGGVTVGPLIASGGSPVASVFGRTGAVVATTGDYTIGQIGGLGTGVATALGINVGSAGSPVINGGVLGTPSSGVATNLTGTAAGLTAGNVTTNANLTGPITSTGNATAIASQTGTGTTFVMSVAPSVTGVMTTQGRVRNTRVVTAAGTVTMLSTDDIVVINKTVAAATIFDLISGPTTGESVCIKDGKGDAATNNITVTPAAGNIDGQATFVMSVNYESACFVENGTQWNVY